MARTSSALLLALLVAAAPTAVAAHFKLLEPASWVVENERGNPQKAAPCGAEPKAEMTGAVTKVTGARCCTSRCSRPSTIPATTGSRSPSTRRRSCRPTR
ncbi:MAG: hypothetical protein R2712_31380 [Vicinamibacterales bacterium]